jgi:3-methyladenine DNA glycosylase AlkD
MEAMAIDLEERARWADQALRKMTDPERQRVTQGYFPTSMETLGVSAPKMRTVLRQLLKDLKPEGPEAVVELAWLLRAHHTHEGRQVAYELFERRPDARGLLRTRDIKKLGKGNDNWASVDAFSVYISGPVWREGGLSDKQILSWTRSKDLWWRRTALVSTVPLNMRSRGGTGDPERTLMICHELAKDKEPMVAKGLSWALRVLIAVDRKAVEGFLARYGDDLPALVRREVRSKLTTGKKNPKR